MHFKNFTVAFFPKRSHKACAVMLIRNQVYIFAASAMYVEDPFANRPRDMVNKKQRGGIFGFTFFRYPVGCRF
jgi:hypothetical protein